MGLRAVLGLVLVVWSLGLAGCSAPGATQQSPSRSHKVVRHQRHQEHRRPRHAPPTRHADQKPAPERGRTYYVARVVDGDTLELGNGEKVRLVGIDTPEVGECGYQEASDALSRMVLGRQVRLTVSDENRDRYGRLLRYVDVGSVDAGLRLIKRGLAVARYDSRDGYGFHPREPVYVAADKASKDFSCPRTAPLVGGAAGKQCAPGYHPCVPPYPPDVDCADVNGPIYVTGSDPHHLDGDGDGVACE